MRLYSGGLDDFCLHCQINNNFERSQPADSIGAIHELLPIPLHLWVRNKKSRLRLTRIGFFYYGRDEKI